jgi:hypothetical protein
MGKKVWVTKEEWATNPSITTCSSKIEVPPEFLSLHPDDYLCIDLDEVPPLLGVKKMEKKKDRWAWVDSQLALGIVIGMGISGALMIALAIIIKLK